MKPVYFDTTRRFSERCCQSTMNRGADVIDRHVEAVCRGARGISGFGYGIRGGELYLIVGVLPGTENPGRLVQDEIEGIPVFYEFRPIRHLRSPRVYRGQ